jgi:hypothetical protein
VHREIVADPSDETMKGFLEELLSYPAVPSRWRVMLSPLSVARVEPYPVTLFTKET